MVRASQASPVWERPVAREGKVPACALCPGLESPDYGEAGYRAYTGTQDDLPDQEEDVLSPRVQGERL